MPSWTGLRCRFNNVLPRGANDCEQLLLLFRGDLELVETRGQIGGYCVEFCVGNLHALVSLFHIPAGVLLWSAGGAPNKLHELSLEPRDIGALEFPITEEIDLRVTGGTLESADSPVKRIHLRMRDLRRARR